LFAKTSFRGVGRADSTRLQRVTKRLQRVTKRLQRVTKRLQRVTAHDSD
jgi:hypothetical protein